MKYKSLVHLKHNGIIFKPGESIENLEDSQIQLLLQKKIIEAVESPEIQESEEKPKKKKSKEE